MIPAHSRLKISPDANGARPASKLIRVIEYIENRLAKRITLGEAASFVGLHPAYLCRKFKKEVGLTFHEYILRHRVQRAVELLLSTEKSIKEISYEIGFNRPEVFSKAFKRLMACPPISYRSRYPSYDTQHHRNSRLDQ